MNLKFALIQATYWMTNCVFFNFLVLLLKDFGYSELQSGVISMVGTIVLTACQPLWGMLCDRAPRIKPILIGVPADSLRAQQRRLHCDCRHSAVCHHAVAHVSV